MTGFTRLSFDLLEGLAAHNDKDWYEANREAFDTHVRVPFEAVLAAATDLMAQDDRPLKGGAGTMFRQNRDIRFSKDKRPYKTRVAGMLTPSGAKDEDMGLVYGHVDAGGGLLAAGYHALDTATLGRVRDRMLARPDAFDDVLAALDAAGFALDEEDALTAMPRGYAEHAHHRHAAALRLKGYTIRETEPKQAWLDGRIPERMATLARTAAPLFAFVEAALGQ